MAENDQISTTTLNNDVPQPPVVPDTVDPIEPAEVSDVVSDGNFESAIVLYEVGPDTAIESVPQTSEMMVGAINSDAQSMFSTDLDKIKFVSAEDPTAPEMQEFTMLVDQTTGEMKLVGEKYLEEVKNVCTDIVPVESAEVNTPIEPVKENTVVEGELMEEKPQPSTDEVIDAEFTVVKPTPETNTPAPTPVPEVVPIPEPTPVPEPIPEPAPAPEPTPAAEQSERSDESTEEDEDAEDESEENPEESEPDVLDAGTEEGVIADEINQRAEMGSIEQQAEVQVSGYDKVRRWLPRIFHGVLDRMEAKSANRKANKLSVYLTRMEAETNSWKTKATIGTTKLTTLQSQLDAINAQSIAPEEKDRLSAPIVSEIGKVRSEIEEAETEINGLIARREETNASLRALEFDRKKAVRNVVDRYDTELNPHKETFAQLSGEREPIANSLHAIKDEIAGLFSRMRKLQADKATASRSHDVIMALNSEINAMYKEQTVLEKQLTAIDSRMVKLKGNIGRIQRERDRYDRLDHGEPDDFTAPTARVEEHEEMVEDAKEGNINAPNTPKPTIPDTLVEDHTVPAGPSSSPERNNPNVAGAGRAERVRVKKVKSKVIEPEPEPAAPSPTPEAPKPERKKRVKKEQAPTPTPETAPASSENTPAPEAQTASPENTERKPASLSALIQRWNRLVTKNKFSDEIKISPKGADKKIVQEAVKILESDDSRATKFDINNLTGADFKEFIEEIVLDKGLKRKKLKEANKVLAQVVSKLKPTVINL